MQGGQSLNLTTKHPKFAQNAKEMGCLQILIHIINWALKPILSFTETPFLSFTVVPG